jgi:8-oxo-dGTP pyrophosphatase MutT (NUDIX family)
MTDRVPEQQYGALPWRRTDGVEILLITSRETKRWLTPKGWPIDGLSPSEGAAQEAFEEAGVRGVANGQSLGSYSYEKKLREGVGKLCRVAVFSLEVTETLDSWPESHERERHWFTAEEAANLVGEPALAAIIRDFAQDQSAPAMQAPTYLREVLQRLTNALRRVAAL